MNQARTQRVCFSCRLEARCQTAGDGPEHSGRARGRELHSRGSHRGGYHRLDEQDQTGAAGRDGQRRQPRQKETQEGDGSPEAKRDL